MADKNRRMGPVFQRVLKCFDTKAQLGEMVGMDRYLVQYWTRLGFIPHAYARRVSIACIRMGGRVTEGEILAEADRMVDLVKALRQQGVKGRSHKILRAASFIEQPQARPITREGVE